MKPIPKVSAAKYEAAKVVIRVKGSGTEGTLFHGQEILKQCPNCVPQVLAVAKNSALVKQPEICTLP